MLMGRRPARRPDLAAYVRLGSLVQPVPSTRLRTGLSPVATSAIFPELDCFQALGIKGEKLRGLPDPSKSAAFLFQTSTRSLTIPVFRMSDPVCYYPKNKPWSNTENAARITH